MSINELLRRKALILILQNHIDQINAQDMKIPMV